MASLTVTVPQGFPVGTTLSVYNDPVGDIPSQGPPLSTAVIAADSTVTLTGLTPGLPYQAGAVISGKWRSFLVELTPPPPAPPVPSPIPIYTLATLPAASAASFQTVWVSDAPIADRLTYSDGTSWRHVTGGTTNRFGTFLFADDFSTDDRVANWTAVIGTLSNWAISAGTLNPTDASGSWKLIRPSAIAAQPAAWAKVKIAAVSGTGSGNGIALKILDANNYLWCSSDFSTSNVSIGKVSGGSQATLTSGSGFTPGAQYMTAQISGNNIVCSIWDGDPDAGGNILHTTSYTLTGADATQFGAGVSGYTGLFALAGATSTLYDNFLLQPSP